MGIHGGGIQWRIAVGGGCPQRGAALKNDGEARLSEPRRSQCLLKTDQQWGRIFSLGTHAGPWQSAFFSEGLPPSVVKSFLEFGRDSMPSLASYALLSLFLEKQNIRPFPI